VPALTADVPRWRDPRVGRASAAGDGPPLAGLRIVDLSMGWAGPTTTRHLADLGADVIKIESCRYPDWWRGVDDRPIVFEQMLYEKARNFALLNRNKRGVTLDLTHPEGVRLVKALVAQADAVVENYSSGVLPKLGLDYPRLREVNPGLVMVSMPAFAADGPLRELRAYGSTLEQASGLPTVSGPPDGPPMLNQLAYGDPIGGLNAAGALLVALLHRARTGEGQHIDLSQVECMLPLTAAWIIEQSANGLVSRSRGNRHPAYVPHGCFRCRGDDAWVLIAATDDAMWHALARAIGRSDLADDATLRTAPLRRAREPALEEAIAAWTGGRSAEEAVAQLQAAGIAAGLVRAPFDLPRDPHLLARGFWQEIDRAHLGRHLQPSAAYRETATPYPVRRAAPTLGEHNEEILGGLLRLPPDELGRLAEAGVIGSWALPPGPLPRSAKPARR
jgi:crotonobetainyl-CoA:carnitine CoA-transferase CaiB-like acyl-CoA transferase